MWEQRAKSHPFIRESFRPEGALKAFEGQYAGQAPGNLLGQTAAHALVCVSHLEQPCSHWLGGIPRHVLRNVGPCGKIMRPREKFAGGWKIAQIATLVRGSPTCPGGGTRGHINGVRGIVEDARVRLGS